MSCSKHCCAMSACGGMAVTGDDVLALAGSVGAISVDVCELGDAVGPHGGINAFWGGGVCDLFGGCLVRDGFSALSSILAGGFLSWVERLIFSKI
jgi:hypothetical protein